MAAFRLTELAAQFGAELRGEDCLICGVATLSSASQGQIAFLANRKYRQQLQQTQASAVILAAADASQAATPVLISDNPYALYAKVTHLFTSAVNAKPGIDSDAVVAESAQIHVSASIAPGAVIEADVVIGEQAVIGPGCVVRQGVTIGAGTLLTANVTICHDVKIGTDNLVHPGAVVGSDGFGLAPEKGTWIKVAQLGSVRTGKNVEIGANTTIDRGALDDTIIEDGVKLDNQIQIAHNVVIGAHTAIAGCTAIAGSTRIGKHCMIAGGVGIAGHLQICDNVTIQAMTLVSHAITRPGVYAGSLPVDEVGNWRKNSVRYRKLDELARRVAALEKGIKQDK
ncbi:MAG TPA: UDP-3-O-(3-hydroxymyristoyl)glucosamine N-acyltransferase [Gammaproteobacteria bacterium]|nr:UDP-3-O-(3-hydroxymyristoyl)glucosamine N-acyltransferase [Gammaproteobacteria bacterium]